MSTTADSVVDTPRTDPRDRTHYLYIAVIVAMVLGIIVGSPSSPSSAGAQVAGHRFVNLIKMMITPIIFCTIVLGIGSVRQAAQVGKVGGLALGYFLTMSTVALAIGLVVGNIVKPGAGLHLTDELAAAGQKQVGAPSTTRRSTSSSGSSPTRSSRRSPRARCCRPCSSRCSSASRCRRWAAPASRSWSASSTSSGSSSA